MALGSEASFEQLCEIAHDEVCSAAAEIAGATGLVDAHDEGEVPSLCRRDAGLTRFEDGRLGRLDSDPLASGKEPVGGGAFAQVLGDDRVPVDSSFDHGG
jgi:hypothetical protein